MLEAGRKCADLFGLYELSTEGTVLYSRARSQGGLADPATDVVGQDFFRDIARFKNVGDLRRHFRSFSTSNQPVEMFLFDCLFETEVVRTKIFMTRAYETNYAHAAAGIVIMDIRRPN